MEHITELMDKLYSDTPNQEFNDAVYQKIQEAFSDGNASLNLNGQQLNFADCGNGSCAIEDVTNSHEVTIAYSLADGTIECKGVCASDNGSSPTLQDVVSSIKKTSGSDGKTDIPAAEPDSTVPEDPSDPYQNPQEAITIEAGITDRDKAGVGKHFSLCFNNFDSEEEANQFYSDLNDTIENSLTFSDDELEDVAFSATELNNDYERLLGTGDIDLAYDVIDRANQLKAYSQLATNYGVDCGDLYEQCEFYSDGANEILTDSIANTDVNDYFSELDEDEQDEFFSNLDEVTANVMMMALEDEDNSYTFSDVDEIASNVYSDLEEEEELSQSFSDVVDELSEEEQDELFSNFNEVELEVIGNCLDADENATFSDINEALDEVNEPLNEMFSYADEDDIEDFCRNFSDDEIDMLSDMLEDGTYTYSDFISAVEANRYFSDDDMMVLENNINQLYSAVNDMRKDPNNVDLASQVLLMSELTLDDCDNATYSDHDVDDVIDACEAFSEEAAEILDKKGVDPEKAVENAAKKVDANSDDIAHDAQKSPTAPSSSACPTEKAVKLADKENKELNKETKKECNTANFSDYLSDGSTKVFSVSNDTPSVNPCLTSPIN